MFLALIPIAFLLHYFIFKPRTDDRRLAALLAALMLGVFVAVATEGLSVFHAVTRMGVAVAWAVICVAAGVVMGRLKLLRIGPSCAVAAGNGRQPLNRTENKAVF